MATFNVQPGVASAVFFILFDLFLLALLDIVLARFVNSVYYRSVNVGKAIPIKSVDIPGVTTFLVGRRTYLPNIIALAVKIGFLICILVIDLGIDAEVRQPKHVVKTTGTFLFDPSDTNFANNVTRRVRRVFERSRQCRVLNRTNERVDFYALIFDLEYDEILEDEVLFDADMEPFLIDLRPSTIHCLAPGKAKDPVLLATVVGCSQQLYKTSCTNETNDEVKGTFNRLVAEVIVNAATNEKATFSRLTLSTEEVERIWPYYPNATVVCMRTQAGTEDILRVFEACMVKFFFDGNTLLERWEYKNSTSTFTRHYPGPVFNGTIDYGDNIAAILLESIGQRQDWASLSATIVADGAIYKQENRTTTVLGPERTETIIPTYAIALAGAMVLVAIVSRVIVAFTIGKDQRPQLNSIDGLSSIAREEHEPTGRSYVGGRGMLIGLRKTASRQDVVRLGPLRSLNEGVARGTEVRVE